jgi:hypothetical protein
LKSASGSGIKPTTITTYKLADNDHYFEEETYHTRLDKSNGFNTTQLLEIFDREQSLYFIVIGGSKTIENIIVSANRNSMLLLPRKWIVIITEPVTDNKFWDRMNPIFSVTDVAIVRRELSVYSECSELKEGCQMRLAFETLRQAIRKVIELPFYDFNDTHQIKAQTKNRVISEMRVSLSFILCIFYCARKAFWHKIKAYFLQH